MLFLSPISPLRLPRCFFTLVSFLAFALLFTTGCASQDVKKIQLENQIQNKRLQALEKNYGRELRKMLKNVKEVQRKAQANTNRSRAIITSADKVLGEQAVYAEQLEKITADFQKLKREMKKLAARLEVSKVEQQKELDAMRLRQEETITALRSPIGDLPDKTKADSAFRQGFAHMAMGKMDLAADQFGQFIKKFPKDKRVAEARFQKGMANVLLNRYDHALIEFFKLVDKYKKHPIHTKAKWMLGRSLEETGDLKLARQIYGQLINSNTPFKNDATRRVHFLDKLLPPSPKKKTKKK